VPGAETLEQNTPTPSSQKLAAALAAAQPPVGIAGANGGHSLADMAQRDLDAALQLLADRAQYITGASGAAIALRRDGRNDMLCRASAGSNAPELGALLSTEFGLSGESVRTRQLLRCDDADRDARVNREVCRQLGIASVLVMPVVNDDQVLGVFELFSGKANAFGERDLSAVQRLSEMVETAVRLAHAAEKLSEPPREQEKASAGEAEVQEGQFLSDLVIEEPEAPTPQAIEADKNVVAHPAHPASPEFPTPGVKIALSAAASNAAPDRVATSHPVPASVSSPVVSSQSGSAPAQTSVSVPEPTAAPIPPKKTLFWSAALNLDAEASKPEEDDETLVPPVLRGLHKCVACGFPVSAGRMLCVECEEKKWRGQLRSSKVAAQPAAKPVAPVRVPPAAEPLKSATHAFAAAAPSMAKASTVVPAPVPTKTPAVSPAVKAEAAVPTSAPTTQEPSKEQHASPLAASTPQRAEPTDPQARKVESASPKFVLSGGLEPSQSWLSRNKYVVGVLLAIAGAAAAFFFLR